MPKRRSLRNQQPVAADIVAMTHDLRGIAEIDGKKVFIDGAITDEKVEFLYTKRFNDRDEARFHNINVAANERVTPVCEHFNNCGGCSIQHIDPKFQLEFKQQKLLEQLQRTAKLKPLQILPAIAGPTENYRRKARLSVRYVHNKGKVLVGFRERYSHYVAAIDSCKILAAPGSDLIIKLQELFSNLSNYQKIPQLEIAIGDEKCALIIRHLTAFTADDLAKIKQFAIDENVEIYLQPKGPDTITKFYPEDQNLRLSFKVAALGLEYLFHPNDFIQVNASVNQKMLGLALELMQLERKDKVLDLFCGLGNFSLALATKAGFVHGVEFVETMVLRAYENAKHNQLENISFQALNLDSEETLGLINNASSYNKILLDPPRTGAKIICENINKFKAERIVYVSCNPATFARDAGILVDAGYKLKSLAAMDMFPHTAHVESIALFTKD